MVSDWSAPAELDQKAAALDRMGGAAMLPEILVQHVVGGLARRPPRRPHKSTR